jgi:hypothetical protein
MSSYFAATSSLHYYHRPGDKRQLKAQDVTAKLVRFDILRVWYQKIFYFVINRNQRWVRAGTKNSRPVGFLL